MENKSKNNDKIDYLLKQEPFSIEISEKHDLFCDAMHQSFLYHYNNNQLFKNLCDNQNFKVSNRVDDLSKYPFIPVTIFKEKNLSSVKSENINRTLTSSATSGIPSKIPLDSITAKRQTIVSSKVMTNYLGNNRREFLVLDENPLLHNTQLISARAAATRGFLILSNAAEYALSHKDDKLILNIDKLASQLEKLLETGKEICIFGFTYILYKNVVEKLLKKNISFQLPNNSKIVHIGGWKKLESEKVSKEKFLKDLNDTFNVSEDCIVDFYGFTEQMGLLYANCGISPKTTPAYSEIIIRNFQTLQPVKDGDEGLIQILTPLPNSYPGISILTEDVGRIISRGNLNGRNGTHFEIIGRASESEVRGCGDIMSEYVA